MNKLKALLFLVIIAFVITSFCSVEKLQKDISQSGFYIVSNDSGTEFELNHTKKYFDIDPVPIVTIKHLVSTNVNMSRKVNGKSFPVITFTFDAIGTSDMNKALAEFVFKRQVGLIIHNKLKLVGEAPFSIKGPSFTCSSSQYDLQQLNSLKGEIDALR